MTPAALLARRRGSAADDSGSAIIEFIFVAVIMLVPLVYLIAAVAVAQRTNLAVTVAARDAGRAYATSDTAAQARQRVAVAVRLALADQGITGADARKTSVRFVKVNTDCAMVRDADRITPSLRPGAQFAVCVSRYVRLPGVPSLVAGHGIHSVSKFVVHVDDFREAPGG